MRKVTHPDFNYFEVKGWVETHKCPYDKYSFSLDWKVHPYPDDYGTCFYVIGKVRPWLSYCNFYVCYDDDDLFIMALVDTRKQPEG